MIKCYTFSAIGICLECVQCDWSRDTMKGNLTCAVEPYNSDVMECKPNPVGMRYVCTVRIRVLLTLIWNLTFFKHIDTYHVLEKSVHFSHLLSTRWFVMCFWYDIWSPYIYNYSIIFTVREMRVYIRIITAFTCVRCRCRVEFGPRIKVYL